ncbi:MAG: dTMP kinase [Candidatus Pacebacteria bacterium CG10_big_fil_rev_8_21_14_0_10_36_11]|nr:dTMP kinase [Candidatus Pacearchaeota archaeon]OIP74023.1 MAG: dTMP kinase [Candidatus Pacebacteria bacterium CG2_30_36_39]PIR64336.1 MAG: dTMP kinase [Candidatus Pacebacteria bacterium CG10_big_fil_rev_8_21_14_0_10_36_11]
MKQKRGILISLEGGEGGGKTTQVLKLKENLEAVGREVVSVREPGGTVISEQIREIVLSAKNKGITDATEVLLFQAARAQIYREVVIPALNAGKVVIMDRTRDSSVVYQGMVRGFGRKMIESLNDISTKKITPNLTLLLDVSVDTGLARRADSGKMDRLDMENKNFHQQVRDAYLLLAKEDADNRWRLIDAEKTVKEVEKQIWNVVKAELKTK